LTNRQREVVLVFLKLIFLEIRRRTFYFLQEGEHGYAILKVVLLFLIQGEVATHFFPDEFSIGHQQFLVALEQRFVKFPRRLNCIGNIILFLLLPLFHPNLVIPHRVLSSIDLRRFKLAFGLQLAVFRNELVL
jgi:hypothetical protein